MDLLQKLIGFIIGDDTWTDAYIDTPCPLYLKKFIKIGFK